MNKHSNTARIGSSPAEAELFATLYPPAPRIYHVRWLDEETGWKSVQVIARTAQDARDIVSGMTGRPDVRVF